MDLHDAQKTYQDADHDSRFCDEDSPNDDNRCRRYAMDSRTYGSSGDSLNTYSHMPDNDSNIPVLFDDSG